jgi:RNA polymerase sigma-70 factor (family 1)
MENPKTDEGRERLEKLKQGDQEAFVQLYRTYKSRIYYNLLRLVKSPDIAEELLQDVFLKVWEHRHSIDPEKPFQSFLLRVASNLAMDFYRKVAKDKRLSEYLMSVSHEGYEHIESGIIALEDAERLNTAINSLPQQRQRVFRLCRIDGMSYEQAANMLDISTGTVKDHLVKAGKFLKQELQSDYKFYLQIFIVACSLK